MWGRFFGSEIGGGAEARASIASWLIRHCLMSSVSLYTSW